MFFDCRSGAALPLPALPGAAAELEAALDAGLVRYLAEHVQTYFSMQHKSSTPGKDKGAVLQVRLPELMAWSPHASCLAPRASCLAVTRWRCRPTRAAAPPPLCRAPALPLSSLRSHVPVPRSGAVLVPRHGGAGRHGLHRAQVGSGEIPGA